jgi:hypothetical protein
LKDLPLNQTKRKHRIMNIEKSRILEKTKDKKNIWHNITDHKMIDIVSRFNSYKRKSAENIIEMGRVVLEAKSLPRDEYHLFCSLIGYDHGSSTIRKLESIGSKYEYLISKSDRLPTNWTVIYEISRLGEDVIEDYIQSNKITDQSTGSAIDKLLIDQKLKVVNKKVKFPLPLAKSVPNGTLPKLNFVASLEGEVSKDALKGLDAIFLKLNDLGFRVIPSLELNDAINNSKTV